jgi:Protein of unknown function (DUF3352)
MRRLLFAVLAVAAAVAIAGCGSSGSSAASSPTVEALSYFPTSSPLVLTLATAPDAPSIKGAHELLHKLPSVTLAETALFARLSQLGFDYNKDIRPLFGNPVVLGFLGTTVNGAQTPFVIAWVTNSASALDALIKKLGQGLQSAGSHDGAKLYVTSGAAVAVDGPTLLFSRSTQVLESALDRHAHKQGFSADQYAKSTTGISQSAVVQAFGDLSGVFSTAKTAKARRIPWVGAITGYGASISAGSAGLTVQYHVDTSGRSLSTAQLPIASGSTAPSVAGDLPIQAGVRDPAQIVNFAEAVAQVTSPVSYAQFLKDQTTLTQKTGFDLRALVAALTGNLNVESDTHTTVARAQVTNPSAVSGMLAKLANAPDGGALSKSSHLSSLGAGLYALKNSTQTLTLGVIGNQLVIGKATAGQLRAFASAPTTTATKATGAITFQIALANLLHITLKHAQSATVQQLYSLLGDITGSASATTSGLTGTATLGLK